MSAIARRAGWLVLADDVPSWDTLGSLLARWYEREDREASRAALTFLEQELRLMTPAIVRRTWDKALIEDAVQTVLLQIIKKPLAPESEIGNLRNYLHRMFRNQCIDVWRRRNRRKEASLDNLDAGWEPLSTSPRSPLEETLAQERQDQVCRAIAGLETSDRIVLKLEHAPEWLDDDELTWLGRRSTRSPEEVRQLVSSASDMFDLSLIFDPPRDEDVSNAGLRRKRMERFRRRRSRARDKCRKQFKEEP